MKRIFAIVIFFFNVHPASGQTTPQMQRDLLIALTLLQRVEMGVQQVNRGLVSCGASRPDLVKSHFSNPTLRMAADLRTKIYSHMQMGSPVTSCQLRTSLLQSRQMMDQMEKELLVGTGFAGQVARCYTREECFLLALSYTPKVAATCSRPDVRGVNLQMQQYIHLKRNLICRDLAPATIQRSLGNRYVVQSTNMPCLRDEVIHLLSKVTCR